MRVITRFYRILRPSLSSLQRSRSLGSWCWSKKQHHCSTNNSPSRSLPVVLARALAVEATATASLGYEVLSNGRKVKFTWANGETSSFHSVWLRHNCQCSDCISSNQKSINPTSLDPNMSVTDVHVSGNVHFEAYTLIISSKLYYDASVLAL